MTSVIRAGELTPSSGGTIKFEGEPYGGGVSFFLVNNAPGEGPVLHVHPYSETWIVLAGMALITIGGEVFEAGPGDIAVGPADTPHKFKNIGGGRLDITCLADNYSAGSGMRRWHRVGHRVKTTFRR